MVLLDIVFLFLGLYGLWVSLYLVVLTLAATLYRSHGGALDPLSLAVIVPAHNEELDIRSTIDGLLAQDIGLKGDDIFVIADNCDDATVARAREAGATALERSAPDNRGKGQALQWCLDTYRDQLSMYDAQVFFDADTKVNPDFLTKMAQSLSKPGVNVVQGRYSVANPGEHWRTALTFAGFALINHVRSLGRSVLGFSSILTGNGMAFRTPVLMELGWPAHSVVEDMEMTLILLLHGYRVEYAAEAVITSDMPATVADANPQRKRWELGGLRYRRAYLGKLIGALLERPSLSLLEAISNVAMLPLSLHVFIFATATLLSALVRPELLVFYGPIVLGTAFYVIVGLFVAKTPRFVWLSLAAAPLFVVWKMGLYCRFLFEPAEQRWERTTRRGPDSEE